MKKVLIENKNKLAIISLSLIFILLLFYLRSKILFTPDFGQSDAYHLNLSLKYFLSQQLKANDLPFWTDQLQGGYPLFSEGQIGSLFLPNIIFLKFFSFSNGYNLLLIFSLFLLTAGFYLLLCEFEVHYLLGLLFGFIFSFNGAVSLRWIHLNLIQSFSLMPFLFLLMVRYYKSKKRIYLAIFPLLLSQMVFAGHLQAVYICLFGLVVWYFLYAYTKSKNLFDSFRHLALLLLLVMIAFIISLPQLLPNYILSQLSLRPIMLDFVQATSFPFNWSNLISFIKTSAFGHPQIASYPVYSQDWGIFWENTPYLGLIFFLLFIVSLAFIFKRKSSWKLILINLFLSILFILLALGKNSPLYFLYLFPPFNFFRTPSKYLLMVNFFLVYGGALAINQLFGRLRSTIFKLVIVVLLFINLIGLIKFIFDYHLFLKNDQVLSAPALSRQISNSAFYFSYGQIKDWNSVFLKKGWATQENINAYLYFKNYLYPDSNLLFGKKNFGINTGTFKLRRPEYLEQLINDNIKNEELSIDEKLKNLLKIIGIKYIISPKLIQDFQYRQIDKIIYNDYKIYLYEYKNFNEKPFYLPKKIKKIQYLDEFKKSYQENQISVDNSVAEDINTSEFDNDGRHEVIIKKALTDKLLISGTFTQKTFLVFRKNYYPEWSVYIDGQKVPVYKTNLIHMGIFIPKGAHIIELKYENFYFKVGLIISLISIYLTYLTSGVRKSNRTS